MSLVIVGGKDRRILPHAVAISVLLHVALQFVPVGWWDRIPIAGARGGGGRGGVSTPDFIEVFLLEPSMSPVAVPPAESAPADPAPDEPSALLDPVRVPQPDPPVTPETPAEKQASRPEAAPGTPEGDAPAQSAAAPGARPGLTSTGREGVNPGEGTGDAVGPDRGPGGKSPDRASYHPPRLLVGALPLTPEEGEELDAPGEIEVRVLVDVVGRVSTVDPLTPDLSPEVLRAVQRSAATMRFVPASRDGRAMEDWFTVLFLYRR